MCVHLMLIVKLNLKLYLPSHILVIFVFIANSTILTHLAYRVNGKKRIYQTIIHSFESARKEAEHSS